MKIAPFIRAINQYNQQPDTINKHPATITHILVHTGQHYDVRMSKAFFDELELPDADINLGIGSGTHAEQVGNTMIAFEKVLKSEKPDWVVVVGDVNATLACSVTAKKEQIRCCHIEAGLRSGDMTMPEEINRLVTDRICDLLLAPDRISVANLKAEGVPESKIRFVGNIMIDTLEASRERAAKISIEEIISLNRIPPNTANANPQSQFNNELFDYCLVTIHRPSNVDEKGKIEPIVEFLSKQVANEMVIIWPVHPRTRKQLEIFGLFDKILKHPRLILLEPLGYFEMLRMNIGAKIMITDSGGLQEECTVLGTPCLTVRKNTERPVTLLENGGASVLTGNNLDMLKRAFKVACKMDKIPTSPELWDGKAGKRCLEELINCK